MKKKTSKAGKTKKTRKPDDLSPRSSRDVKGGVAAPTKIEYPNIVLKRGTSG